MAKHDDPPILAEILKAVADRTTAGQWISVNELPLDHRSDEIDAALRVLADRNWIATSPQTLHSVSITVEGRKQVESKD